MIRAEFSSSLPNLQCSSQSKWPAILKDIAAAIHSGTVDNLRELLELLSSTPDYNIQIKLLTLLSSYLLSNGLHYELIVKYSPLYETVQNLLMRSLPSKATIVLNFISALVCSNEEDSRQSLMQYAQNVLRVSGCLNTMSDMFVGSMMYQDAWVALCQSIAETCRNSEVNQNYCSHLVPLCIQRCRKGMDVCLVLQSLLQNNNRNIELFLDNNGLIIFTRQLLQNNMGIQLLNTITEKSSRAVIALLQTQVVHHLRDFFRIYGPHSQMGQWSTIILFHLNAQSQHRNTIIENMIQGPEKQTRDVMRTYNEMRKHDVEFTDASDLRQNVNLLSRHDFNINSNRNMNLINNSLTHHTEPKDESSNDIMISNQNNTTQLFQNVIKEVIYWRSKSANNYKSKVQVSPVKNRENFQKAPIKDNIRKIQEHRNDQNIIKGTKEHDLTFSFLYKENGRPEFSGYKDKKLTKSFLKNKMSNMKETTLSNKGIQTDNSGFKNLNYNDRSFTSLANFKPPFISTPKRCNSQKRCDSRISFKSMSCRKQVTSKKREISKSQNSNKETKNRSMSARFFNAINESCTTIVKSVKNIFGTNQNKTTKQMNNEMDKSASLFENASCSYSFTNYMRMRDGNVKNKHSSTENTSGEIYKLNSCKTCKDTIILQEKMAIDSRLRRTVKRLKQGLNLYGCDFKKICRMVWPRDRYMTPEILYDLYRKLIVNGGHSDHEFRYRASKLLRKGRN